MLVGADGLDMMIFRHVNNVKILGYFESARIKLMESWADILPKELVQDMLVRGYLLFLFTS